LRKDETPDRIGGMNIYVATRNPIKLQAVRDAFAEWFAEVEVNVRAIEPTGRLPEQPLDGQVGRGAIARAKSAVESNDADRGVGIEAGLIRLPESDRWLSVQVCAIADRRGRMAIGTGPGFELPDELRKRVLAGTPLRDALRSSVSVEDAQNRGAIYYLSGRRLDRYEITRTAVRMALVSSANR
jgi:inosine/xanthosine triphosphatase